MDKPEATENFRTIRVKLESFSVMCVRLIAFCFSWFGLWFLQPLSLSAQSELDSKAPFEFGFMAGLNSDGYEVSAAVSWFPVSYVGLKADLGFAGEIKELADWGTEYTDKSYCIRFKFTPSVEFRTPALVHWPRKKADFRLFANPGLTLSPGGAGSHDADWCNWTVRTGILFHTSTVRIAVGYGISDYYLLSGNAHSCHLLFSPGSRPLTHSGFVSASFTL